MKLHKYGSYDEYLNVQKNRFNKPENCVPKVWMKQEEADTIASFFRRKKHVTGVCHGVRGGQELLMIRKSLKRHGVSATIYGTEIADISKTGGVDNSNNPFIFNHDFNKPFKIGEKFDFVYSNSLDHSLYPQKTVAVWMSSLDSRGICFIEWDKKKKSKSNSRDPFAGSLKECVSMFKKKYLVDAVPMNNKRKTHLLCLSNKPRLGDG